MQFIAVVVTARESIIYERDMVPVENFRVIKNNRILLIEICECRFFNYIF